MLATPITTRRTLVRVATGGEPAPRIRTARAVVLGLSDIEAVAVLNRRIDEVTACIDHLRDCCAVPRNGEYSEAMGRLGSIRSDLNERREYHMLQLRTQL